jgi:2-keto-4-pentenoate hydratase/2-oxohepta-3-ene-1,7-dioic acid hydratase in catechol pathway
MKLCTFSLHPGSNKVGGLIDQQGVVDLSPLLKTLLISDLKGVIEGNAIDKCKAYMGGRSIDYALNEIEFLPVIPNPGKIIQVGINYHEHKIETGNPDYPHPMLFTRYPESQVGHLQAMLKPRESEKLDFEGELAVIIGKTGRRISQQNALSHIAGYSCYNDGSVRDFQRHTTQYLPGKSFVGTGGFGPCMVTADDIPDPSQLKLETRLNGRTVQSTTTDLMINPVPVLIEYISTVLPLNPGDVIVSGTPGGVGARRTPPLFMFAGDTIEVEISNIGTLTNPIQND